MLSAHEQQVAALEAAAEQGTDAARRAAKARAAIAAAAEQRAEHAAEQAADSTGGEREARSEPPAGRKASPRRETADTAGDGDQ